MEIDKNDLLIRIIKLEDFKEQIQIDIKRVRVKVEEEILEVKKMNLELKDNLDAISKTLTEMQYTINSTFIKAKYAFLGSSLMVILYTLGIPEFIKQLLRIV